MSKAVSKKTAVLQVAEKLGVAADGDMCELSDVRKAKGLERSKFPGPRSRSRSVSELRRYERGGFETGKVPGDASPQWLEDYKGKFLEKCQKVEANETDDADQRSTSTGVTVGTTTEESTISTTCSAAPDWSRFSKAFAGSSERVEFTKVIPGTGLKFLAIPSAHRQLFPAGAKVTLVRAEDSGSRHLVQVSLSEKQKGSRYFYGGWNEFTRANGIQIGDTLHFKMKGNSPGCWEFSVTNQGSGDATCDAAKAAPEIERGISADGTCDATSFAHETENHIGTTNSDAGSIGDIVEPAGLDHGLDQNCNDLWVVRNFDISATPAPVDVPDPALVDGASTVAEIVVCMVCGVTEPDNELLLCDWGGGTGCSSACHLACCDPPLAAVPDGEWFCSRCQDRCAKVACMVCGRTDGEEDMLLCDGGGCNLACHMSCCTPPLTEVPDGQWFCAHCQCNDTACLVCGREDGEAEMLLCDTPGCDNGCHMRCCTPPLLEVPEEDWFCPSCQGRGTFGPHMSPAASACTAGGKKFGGKPTAKRKCGRPATPGGKNGRSDAVIFGEALRLAHLAHRS
mmetsp:Transcript_24766/g.47503  ORF Transcript_24766/g.47503 Transcript_24766/m.47503 type:complete len:567 (-) Transcript_24766:37-1737(-)